MNVCMKEGEFILKWKEIYTKYNIEKNSFFVFLQSLREKRLRSNHIYFSLALAAT